MNLSSTIKSIQDIMRKDDGVDGDAQRLGQLTWMLFLKVFDQREEDWEGDNAKYKSPMPERFRWRNWAGYEVDAAGKKKPKIAPSALIGFVNNDLFPALKSLDASASEQHKVVRGVFEDANNYMKSGPQLLAVIEKLEEAINFHDFKIRANLGDVYEQLLNDLRGAGNAGEFYTPRAITQFMVGRVNPNLAKRETVLDPACGTGGFLTAAIDHFRHQLAKMKSPRPEDSRFIERLIRGFEKKQLPHLLCTTNMLLHGIDVPSQIEHRNTLSVGWNEWRADERVKCIITNPPFGGYEDDTVGAGYHHPTKETADLFMQLVVKLLEVEGRAAVVLPDGFLFGEGIKSEIKKRLMQQCKLHTIIRLPKGVFAPYTTIKTNLLFFTKGAAVEDGTEHFHTDTIWFYEHPYPPGYKSYSKTKPIDIKEFVPEEEWWGTEDNDFADRVESEFAWRVDFKTKREQAERAAKPHWENAEVLKLEVSSFELRLRQFKELLGDSRGEHHVHQELKHLATEFVATSEEFEEPAPNDLPSGRKALTDTIRQRWHGAVQQAIQVSLSEKQSKRAYQAFAAEQPRLKQLLDQFRMDMRDAQAAGDRLYWPIFNLDLKNPNAPEEETHDPDVLLEKYKKLLGEIEETENQLKSELAAALAHHFTPESAE